MKQVSDAYDSAPIAAIPNSNLQTYVLPQQGTKLLGFSRSDLLVEFDHDQKRTVDQGF